MLMFSHSLPGIRSKSRAGFGLVELLVSISIMVLVTTVILANHTTFTNNSLLRTQAYDVALRIREAQQGAVSVQGSAGDFSTLFGVRWQNTVANRYDIFSIPTFDDVVGRDLDPARVTQYGSPGLLDRRFSILCVQQVVGTPPTTCSSSPSVYIVFKRPNFDALFYDANGNRLNNVDSVIFTIGRIGDVYDAGAIGTTQRSVTITRSGQITVE